VCVYVWTHYLPTWKRTGIGIYGEGMVDTEVHRMVDRVVSGQEWAGWDQNVESSQCPCRRTKPSQTPENARIIQNAEKVCEGSSVGDSPGGQSTLELGKDVMETVSQKD
jgi:hypothetical protein